jgi:hypothetical protein
MITAKELFDKMLNENDECTSTEMMIEFAKLHVEAALKEAIEKIEMDVEYDTDRIAYPILEEYSILNSYPLTNIK